MRAAITGVAIFLTFFIGFFAGMGLTKNHYESQTPTRTVTDSSPKGTSNTGGSNPNTQNLSNPGTASVPLVESSGSNIIIQPSSTPKVPASNSTEDLYKVTYSTFDIRRNDGKEGEFESIVEITNTSGVDLYLGSNNFFDVEDPNGHLVGREDIVYHMPDVIGPGEKGWFYTPFYGKFNSSDNLNYHMCPHLDVRISNNPPEKDYKLSDIQSAEDSFGNLSIVGRVTNDRNIDDEYLAIDVVAFDGAEHPIGFSSTYVVDLSAGTTQSFDVSFLIDGLKPSEVKNCTIYARPMYIQF